MMTIFDFLPEIVGSLIGVFLGYCFGILLERRMRKEESRERKCEYVNAVLNEIKRNKDIISSSSPIDYKLEDGYHISYYPEHLPTESVLSGIYSGEFRTLSVDLQSKLVKYLMYCNYINSFIDTLNFSSPSSTQAKNLAQQSVHYFNRLRNYINEVIQQLQIESTSRKDKI